jgi:hypothetical protein
MKLAIRSISLQSLAKTGCFLGIVLACLPSLLCGILGMTVVEILRHWLEGWEKVSITIFGQQVVSVDLLQKLGLTDVLSWLQAIGGASWLVVALVVLALGLFTGLVLASITVLAGLAYNSLASATGGVVVNAAVVGEQPGHGGGQQLVLRRREPAVRLKRTEPEDPQTTRDT